VASDGIISKCGLLCILKEQIKGAFLTKQHVVAAFVYKKSCEMAWQYGNLCAFWSLVLIEPFTTFFYVILCLMEDLSLAWYIRVLSLHTGEQYSPGFSPLCHSLCHRHQWCIDGFAI
jgi:hypothetical protein